MSVGKLESCWQTGAQLVLANSNDGGELEQKWCWQTRVVENDVGEPKIDVVKLKSPEFHEGSMAFSDSLYFRHVSSPHLW